MLAIKSIEDLYKEEQLRKEKSDILQNDSNFALSLNEKLRKFGINHPPVAIERDIDYYFKQVKSRNPKKEETRLQHILRHYNTSNRDPVTVKESLYHFLQKVINPFESPLNEIEELFNFIADVSSMKYHDTIVFHSVSRDDNKVSKHLSFYHLSSNILIHLKKISGTNKYEVLTCYVHTKNIRNDWDLENGICPISGYSLKALTNLSDTQLEELAMINFELVAHNKQIFQSLQLPNNVNVSTKPTKKVISNNLQSVEDKRSSFPIPKQKIAA
jgi:hypothetical protein